MGAREQRYMNMAAALSRQGMTSGRGGPFGTVIVRGDEIIATGYNRVLGDQDPTAHAEIVAIREACRRTGSFLLTGCELYASSEPCPMCLGAIYWARPDRVYYANTRGDAAAIGFDDAFIYEELKLPYPERKIPFIALSCPEAAAVFRDWREKTDKQTY